MKLRYTLLLALACISTQLFSQNAKLSGVVKNQNGEVLIAANVVIDASKGWAAVTDFDGKYEINIPAGTHEVQFRYIGQEDQKIPLTLTAGEIKVLNITMKEKQTVMDVVVVTGSKYQKKMSEETVSMDVLKGTSLSNQNVVTLDAGMAKIPGVTIADGQVNIRGGTGWSYGAGSRVQVLIDDLPLLSADASDAKWTIVPMENVDQVEIIKGAASALYGSGALDGIVNVRTAYPTDEPYVKVGTYVGAFGNPTRSPRMRWWGTNTPLGGGTNFAIREKFGQHDLVMGGAIDGTSGYLDSSDAHAVRGNIKYRWRVKTVPGLNMGINLSGYYSWGKTFFFWNGLDSLGYKPFPGTISQYKAYRFTVDPFIDYADRKNNHIKFMGRFFNAENTTNTGQGSNPNKYYVELQYHHKFDFRAFDFNLVTGVVNSYDDVTPPKTDTNSLFGKASGENFSVYAQTDFKFFKRLTLSLGARWEYFDTKHYLKDSTNNYQLSDHQNSLKNLPYPLVRVGLNVQAAEATYFRASFGQGFRYPTIAERYIYTNVGPLTIASNPKLQPEKGYSAEVGFKQGFKLGKNWVGFIDLAGFWNQYDNMMEFTFGQFGDTTAIKNGSLGVGFSSQNIGKTRILGGEFVMGGQGKIGQVQLDLVAGYTYIDPRSLNWNDSINLYDNQGVKLKPYADLYLGGFPAGTIELYNPANYPKGTPVGQFPSYITYAMTSSSTKNVLKYRNRHTVKVDLTLGWKGIEWNTNLQYASYMENIDGAFTGKAFKNLGPTAFDGLDIYRNHKEQIPIGKGRGDIVWNMHLAYNFKAGVRVAFIVKNILNWEYTPRPASFAEPRNYTIQLSYVFRGKPKKQAE